MKNLATGLLTVLCATAFSFAQSYDQPYEQTYDQNYGQADYTQTAPTAVEAPAYAEPQAEQQVKQNTEVPQTATEQASTNATNDNVANTSIENNDPMPIDEQSVKKRAPISLGVNATFIYGKFWGFEELKTDGYDDPTGIGGEFGIAGRFTITEGLQFSPEISFRIFNVSHKDGDGSESNEREYKQMFIDFALYLRGVLGNGFFLEIAPQLAINTSAEYTIDGEDYNKFGNVEQATAEFGLNIGLGYFILDNLSINFRWYMGFNEIFPDVNLYDDIYANPDYLDKNNEIKKGTIYSDIHLKGAHSMMFKFGVTYWFI